MKQGRSNDQINQMEGRSVGFHGDEKQMKMKMREGRREKWNERVVRLSIDSKTPEGREVSLL